MKTIAYGEKREDGRSRRYALVELTDGELSSIGLRPHDDPHFTHDPAKFLAPIIDYDRRQAAKLIDQSGPLAIVESALEKLRAYLKAAPRITDLTPAGPVEEAIAENREVSG